MADPNSYEFADAKSAGLLLTENRAESNETRLVGDLVGFDPIDKSVARTLGKRIGSGPLSQVQLLALLTLLEVGYSSTRVLVRAEIGNLSDESLTVNLPRYMAVEISTSSYEPYPDLLSTERVIKAISDLTDGLRAQREIERSAIARLPERSPFDKPAWIPVVCLESGYKLSLAPFESISRVFDCMPGQVEQP